jgi:hypothetical protein
MVAHGSDVGFKPKNGNGGGALQETLDLSGAK